MKKTVVIVALTLFICACLNLISSVSASADEDNSNWLPNYKAGLSNFSLILKDVETSRADVFENVLNNVLNWSGSIFVDSTMAAFNPDYLAFCFQHYVIDDQQTSSLIGCYDDYIKSRDISFSKFLNNLLSSYNSNSPASGSGGGGGSVTISSDDYKDALETADSVASPKSSDSSLKILSYRNLNYYPRFSLQNLPLSEYGFQFYNSGTFTKYNFSELYFVPFFKDDNGTIYYCQNQFHLYIDVNVTDANSSYNGIFLEKWDYSNSGVGVSSSGIVSDPVLITTASPVASLPSYLYTYYQGSGGYYLCYTDSLEQYSDRYGSRTFTTFAFNRDFIAGGSTVIAYNTLSTLRYNNLSDHPYMDWGYIVSDSKINMFYGADVSSIPSGQVITIDNSTTSGDTITSYYEYNITNPATGQSSTINEYITNNYNYLYPPADDTSGGSSGGSTNGTLTGDVTVGGAVAVGGQIDVNGAVDVNINVNTNGAGNGNGGNNIDTSLDMDPVEGYLHEALEESSGFRQFLGLFFSFLPPEILTLFGILISVVILCRIFGR